MSAPPAPGARYGDRATLCVRRRGLAESATIADPHVRFGTRLPEWKGY